MLNVYVPNNTASKYTKEELIELQGEIVESTLQSQQGILVLFLIIDWTSRKKISKNIDLNNTVNQLDLTGICL